MRTFQGDPKIILTPDGSTLKFIGGQPVMDAGVENVVTILLFTKKGWCGNYVLSDINRHIGSDFEAIADREVSLQNLQDLEEEAQRALEVMKTIGLAESISAVAVNPTGNEKQVTITVKRPNREAREIVFTKNDLNWQFQINDPAYKKI